MHTEDRARLLKRQTLRIALYDAFGVLPAAGHEIELAKRVSGDGKFTSAGAFIEAAQRHASAMAEEMDGALPSLELVPKPRLLDHKKSK